MGLTVTRHGDDAAPAYTIETDDGRSLVLRDSKEGLAVIHTLLIAMLGNEPENRDVRELASTMLMLEVSKHGQRVAREAFTCRPGRRALRACERCGVRAGALHVQTGEG